MKRGSNEYMEFSNNTAYRDEPTEFLPHL